ncbi:hypothetical protein [Burkholderia stagnalis]|uniref:hypothetical protein n=1 Tax=Burkholderia stagnalis TaxID=1503054 RepID=UPI002EDA7ECD
MSGALLLLGELGPDSTDDIHRKEIAPTDNTLRRFFDRPTERNRHWPFPVRPCAEIRRVCPDRLGKFHEPTTLAIKIGSQIHGETLAKRERLVYSVSRMYDFSDLLLNAPHEGH